jgi:hypothetical protein
MIWWGCGFKIVLYRKAGEDRGPLQGNGIGEGKSTELAESPSSIPSHFVRWAPFFPRKRWKTKLLRSLDHGINFSHRLGTEPSSISLGIALGFRP